MASQSGPAAEPVPVTSDMMQVVRDEHDLVTDMVREQLAKERDRDKEPRTALSTSPNVVGKVAASPVLPFGDAAIAKEVCAVHAALTPPAKEYSGSHATCPSWGQALRLARIVRGTDGLVDLQTFACRACSLWVTETAEEHKPA
jgi:hypothetical protein